ncbi:CrcB family protein [Aminipila butyrica]|uniref:Fluoride-specific ion channel FluC n=1 Tax=Aminipila butyrica TaxID=433296 RepID=A0A858BZB1_9FIRM|nr:CrcB family protein [Aminipila butyrica]QIB70064.1 CrcB family protein [Aminipila butyrica]
MYYIYIAIFGAIGSALRYWISITLEGNLFPYGTFLINIAGSFLLAVVVTYLSTLPGISNRLVVGLGTGLIGSFTTFSAFSVQAADFILNRHYVMGGAYVLISLLCGFLSAALGVYASNKWIVRRGLTENE